MRRDAETLSTKRHKLVNVEGEKGRARKIILESQLRELMASEEEDREWAQAGDGEKSRAAAKREEEARKRAEAAAGKALAMEKVEQEVRDVQAASRKKLEAVARERRAKEERDPEAEDVRRAAGSRRRGRGGSAGSRPGRITRGWFWRRTPTAAGSAAAGIHRA